MHLTIGAFGNVDFVKKMAKPGTVNDLSIYNHASSEGVLTFVHVNSDKIQPLLQAMCMIDFPVIMLSEMSRETGEQIVAIDSFGFSQGFIVLDGFDEEKARQIVKGTSMENFSIMQNDLTKLRQAMLHTSVERDVEGSPWLPIDNYFKVKGIGTVVLSVIRQGRVKKFDPLRVEPIGRDITIKSIQSQDNDIAEAEAGMRVGLNVKGVEAEELKRGYIVCKDALISKEISVEFRKSGYFRDEIKTGDHIFVASDLQYLEAVVADIKTDAIGLKIEQPLVYKKGQKLIFASTKQILPRIIGSGRSDKPAVM